MQLAGVYVETVRHITVYPPVQVERAVKIAWEIQRGKLVLCEPPWPPRPHGGGPVR